jgi:hypothetical protein
MKEVLPMYDDMPVGEVVVLDAKKVMKCSDVVDKRAERILSRSCFFQVWI